MSKYVREVDSIQQLRNTPTSDAAAAHVRTPMGRSGIFAPFDADPFGRGDDGAVALEADDGTWWAREGAREDINARWFGEGEQALFDALDFAEFGTRVVIPPGMEPIETSEAVEIPKGVTLKSQQKRSNASVPTIRKQHGGAAIIYDDWVHLINIIVDGNKSERAGPGIIPGGSNNRELYFRNVSVFDVAQEAFQWRETYLSTFIGCSFLNSNSGLLVTGESHSPHNSCLRCRFSGNKTDGIRVEYRLDGDHFTDCFIDRNGRAGVSVANSTVGLALQATTSWNGCSILSNDGPAFLQSGTPSNMGLSIGASTIIGGNNQNPPGYLDNPVGAIHSQNGGQIRGQVLANASIKRNGSNGDVGHLLIGDNNNFVTLPDTNVVALGPRTPTVNDAGSLVAMDGETASLTFSSTETYNESNVNETRAVNANSTTTDELADVLGTLIQDLRDKGIVE